MNILQKTFSVGLLLSLAIHISSGANLYLLHDQDCVDRFLYLKKEGEKEETTVVYRLKAGASSFVFLEISAETPRSQETLPTQIYACGSNFYNEKMVEAINSGKDQAFLVMREQSGGYKIYKIAAAAYMQQMGAAFTYIANRYDFTLNANSSVVNEDISVTKRPGIVLSFQGKYENACSGAYILRYSAPNAEIKHMDILFTPELGIQEERRGLNASDALNNYIQLDKINDYTTADYLRLLCERTSPVADKTAEKSIPKSFDQTLKTPVIAKSTVSSNPNPCSEVSGGGIHVVQRGETLYRISKMYNVTVSQIQAWNSLGSSTNIRVCDKLRVSDRIVAAPPAVTPKSGVSPSVTVPAPYENARFTSNKAWENTTGYYVVQPGETVAMVAAKFGYTEARFRSFNGLANDEVVKPGTMLRTSDCAIPTAPSSGRTSMYDGPTDYSQYGVLRTAEFTVKAPGDNAEVFTVDRFKDERITPQIYSNPAPDPDFRPRGISEEQNRNTVSRSFDQTIPQGYEAASLIKRATHTVRSGETIAQIARMYGMTEERLRTLNDLSYYDTVIPNQVLFIN